MLITKGNLLSSEESLRLAKLGYELIHRKRMILMQELNKLMDDVKDLRDVIDKAYEEAYESLQKANVSSVVIHRLAQLMPIEDDIKIVYRSVSVIEILRVTHDPNPLDVPFALGITNSHLD